MPNELNPFSDRIHIEQLEVFARVGVPEIEREKPQRLTVSITLWPKQDTRDLENFVRVQSVNLIETLADRLAMHLLKTFPTQKVTVELRKFPLEDAEYVSVTVTRAASVS